MMTENSMPITCILDLITTFSPNITSSEPSSNILKEEFSPPRLGSTRNKAKSQERQGEYFC